MTPRAALPPVRKLTPRILARWLHVNPHTVLKWVATGELPALNISTGPRRRLVIYRRDLVTFLRRRGMSPQQISDLGLERLPADPAPVR